MEAYQISKAFKSALDFVQSAPTTTPKIIFCTLKRKNTYIFEKFKLSKCG